MATYVPLTLLPIQFQDVVTSRNLLGGSIEFYLAGTSTPTNLFSDNIGTSIGTSITLNSGGMPESGGNVIVLWRDDSIALKLVLKNAAGEVIDTSDNLPAPIDGRAQPYYEQTAAEISAGVTPVNYQYEPCNVLRYGTNTTPGTTDMSAAFAAAIAVANQLSFSSVYQHGTGKVRVPAGDYLVNTGVTVANLRCQIEGDGRSVTRIKVASGQYWLTVTDTIAHFGLFGITFYEGAGYIKHTSTATNVQDRFNIKDCSFFLYTECAIGSLSSDFPYWELENLQFYGSTALTSKAIVHSGNPDDCVALNCSFLRNRYHVKLARGNNWKFFNCDFIRFQDGGGSPILVDIWVVPYDQVINAGAGLEFIGCKFGNETLNVNDYRILVADEGSGTNAIDKNHSTSASSNYLDGLAIRGGIISGQSGMNRGFVYSFTPNLRNFYCDAYWDGSRFPYVVEFDSGVTVPNDRFLDTWTVHLNGASSATEQTFGALSNLKFVNNGRDPMSLHFGQLDHRSTHTVGFDPGYKDLWNQANSGATVLTTSNASLSNVADSTADADAVEVTYSSSTGLVTGDVDTPTEGRLLWAEIEVMTGSSLALGSVDIRVNNSAGDIIARRVVKVPATWQRIRVPTIVRDDSSGVHLTVLPGDYSAGVRTKVKLGRPRVYHATEPTDYGHRYLSAQKTQDWGSISDGASATTTVTVTGAALGDFALASMSLSVAGLSVTAYVSAADTVTVVAANLTGSPVDLGSGTLRVRVEKAVRYAA